MGRGECRVHKGLYEDDMVSCDQQGGRVVKRGGRDMPGGGGRSQEM